MLSEESVLLLSQLVLAMRETLNSLEKAIALGDSAKISVLKNSLSKLNNEIEKNIKNINQLP
jgi:hypothetical protein